MAGDYEPGNSPAGRDFAARHAEINFVLGPDLAAVAATAAEVKRDARDRYGQAIQVFAMAHVVCRESTTEASRYFDYYVHEKGDAAGGRNVLAMVIPNAQSVQYDAMIDNIITGYGALPLIGTPEQVADGIVRIVLAGIDGLTLCWVDYDSGIKQYRDEVRPLLIQSDIRNS